MNYIICPEERSTEAKCGLVSSVGAQTSPGRERCFWWEGKKFRNEVLVMFTHPHKYTGNAVFWALHSWVVLFSIMYRWSSCWGEQNLRNCILNKGKLPCWHPVTWKCHPPRKLVPSVAVAAVRVCSPPHWRVGDIGYQPRRQHTTLGRLRCSDQEQKPAQLLEDFCVHKDTKNKRGQGCRNGSVVCYRLRV